MIEKLKQDIMTGKIRSLTMVSTNIDTIRHNCYAMMFNVSREISRCDDDRFYLLTERCTPSYSNYNGTDYRMPDGSAATGNFVDCEAYYTAFDYYDGKVLKSGHTIYECN